MVEYIGSSVVSPEWYASNLGEIKREYELYQDTRHPQHLYGVLYRFKDLVDLYCVNPMKIDGGFVTAQKILDDLRDVIGVFTPESFYEYCVREAAAGLKKYSPGEELYVSTCHVLEKLGFNLAVPECPRKVRRPDGIALKAGAPYELLVVFAQALGERIYHPASWAALTPDEAEARPFVHNPALAF